MNDQRNIILRGIFLGLAAVGLYLFFQSLLSYFFFYFKNYSQYSIYFFGFILGASLAMAMAIYDKWFERGVVKRKWRNISYVFVTATWGSIVFGFAHILEYRFVENLIFLLFWNVNSWLLFSIGFYCLTFNAKKNTKQIFNKAFPKILIILFLISSLLTVAKIYLNLPFLTLGCFLIFFNIMSFFATYQRKHHFNSFIKVLNGLASGKIYSVENEESYIGSGYKDCLCFNGYNNLNLSHAKIIRQYDSDIYTFINNDPYLRSWINFRPCKEQLLRNGDIIKLGNLKLQFCQL